MAKLVVFMNTDEEVVAVNPDQVTYLRTSGHGTLIAFGKDRGVVVTTGFDEVVAKLEAAMA